MKTNPFDYIKSINEKTSIGHSNLYNPFLGNLSLSYSLDTLLLANEMNQYPNLPPLLQYDFLYGTVKKGRRYNKWYKHEDPPHLEAIMKYYGYSKKKAYEALEVLTQDQIRKIISSQDTGGTK